MPARKKMCGMDCNEQPCKPSCGAGLDIGIILDKSGSVEREPLGVAIDLLQSLIGLLNPAPSGNHFGLITYSKDPTMVFHFSDARYHNLDDLLMKMNDQRGYLRAYTRTDKALKMARDQLFTAAKGDRPDKADCTDRWRASR